MYLQTPLIDVIGEINLCFPIYLKKSSLKLQLTLQHSWKLFHMRWPDFFSREATMTSFRSFLSSRTSKHLMKTYFCLYYIMDHGAQMSEFIDTQADVATKFDLLFLAY